MIVCYRDPMLRAKALSKKQAAQLFSSSVLDDMWLLSVELARVLQQRVESWHPLQTVGDVMCDLAPLLHRYRAYVENYDRAAAFLAEKLKTDQRFAALHRRCKVCPRSCAGGSVIIPTR